MLLSTIRSKVEARIETRGAQDYNIKGGPGERSIVDYRPEIFLRNFFRTPCYDNEEESECQIMTHITCWDHDDDDDDIRNYTCRYGCDCKNGYFRNSQGYCVLEKHCDLIRKPINFVEPLTVHMGKFLKQRKIPSDVQP
ncbi:hypothetical protein PV327_002872 [Microctonus hyperodae]|uniref:TIL domain-containing protein n=1 Tax=Microctonus hyperodae TaxID=165561 RepID=A0AA39FGT4_MICHY|nr:hypothetical protein PV327_002872 [Microctonus hyperodae]